MSKDETDRRTVLQRLGAVGTAAAVGAGSATADAEDPADPAVRPAAARATLRGNEQLLRTLADRGVLASASVAQLSFRPQGLRALAEGEEGVTRVDPDGRDIVVTQRRLEPGRLWVAHDRTLDRTYAVVTRDGDRSVFLDSGEVRPTRCYYECTETACDFRYSYYTRVYEEVAGDCVFTTLDCLCSQY